MLYNESGTIGTIITYANTEVTGSLFLTLLGVVLLVLMLCFLFRLPIEFSAVLVLPLLLGLMGYMQKFVAIGGVFLIYLGIVMGKNFFFR
jgi:hypothetical protein